MTNQKEVEDISNNSNIIKDIEYRAKDTDGNEYIITAKQGEIDYSNSNILYLTKVVGLIRLVNSENITITSRYGKYNSENFDTIFSKNVIINYLDKNNFNIIIMDDGLQNYQLEQDIKFLLVDKNLKFGNEFCIPAGPLREPVDQGLIRIDAIVLTGNNNKDADFNNVHNKTIFNSKVKTIKSPKIKNEKLLAFCGLANSNKFYEILKENGFNVTSTKSFPDHYEYKNEDIDKLISEANKQNLKLITTEKDYVKIKDNKNLINTLPIEMELDLKDKAVFNSFLQEKLNG